MADIVTDLLNDLANVTYSEFNGGQLSDAQLNEINQQYADTYDADYAKLVAYYVSQGYDESTAEDAATQIFVTNKVPTPDQSLASLRKVSNDAAKATPDPPWAMYVKYAVYALVAIAVLNVAAKAKELSK